MGILNITPDSFYDKSRFSTKGDLLKRTEIMLSEGATFIDVGAYSSRPGAEFVSKEEERKRRRRQREEEKVEEEEEEGERRRRRRRRRKEEQWEW